MFAVDGTGERCLLDHYFSRTDLDVRDAKTVTVDLIAAGITTVNIYSFMS